jgi:hypothetical protein
MDKTPASFATYALALLRIIAGVLFFAHSGQKVFGWFGGQPVQLGSLFGSQESSKSFAASLLQLVSSRVLPRSSPAAKWLPLISSAIFRKVFGLWKTLASQRAVLFHIFVYGDPGLRDLECRCATAPVMDCGGGGHEPRNR